jgi:hypothetical protein
MVAWPNKTAGYIYILSASVNICRQMSEYESGTFRCRDCAKEFLTKDEADRHYKEHHSDVTVGE